MLRTKDGHIVPFDFTRFVDGELTEAERELLLHHVATCEQCAKELSVAQDVLARLPGVVQPVSVVPQDEARSQERLLVSLDQIAEKDQRAPWHWGLLAVRRYATYASLAAMIALSAAAISYRHGRRIDAAADLLPKKTLTPGAVRNVALEELCQVGDDDDLDPVVSVPVQRTVFTEYGIAPEQSKVNFQMDYLINPQLGGVEDVRNLWPQPYTSEWNARAKDELERHLHQMVCERKIELADAQREIAENWIDAYKKYFHTSKPI